MQGTWMRVPSSNLATSSLAAGVSTSVDASGCVTSSKGYGSWDELWFSLEDIEPNHRAVRAENRKNGRNTRAPIFHFNADMDDAQYLSFMHSLKQLNILQH